MNLFTICLGLLLSLSTLLTAKDAVLFPEETLHLRDLKARAKKLRKDDCRRGRKIIEKIDATALNNKKIQAFSLKSAAKNKKIAGRYHPPFDKNRAGRKIKGLYVNASDVRMKRQNYVLASLPRTHHEVRDYFEAALAQDVQVFVSALCSTEAKSRCNNFWKNDVLKKITLRDGSKITHGKSQVLHILENSRKKLVPQIIESTLYTSDERKITHLHYEGWQDKHGMPCEELLANLLDRIYELSPDPKVPVAINCRGGAGRTGTVAVSLYLRREVDAQLAQGKDIDDIQVNIPEVIYSFRFHRKSIVGSPEQLAQIYSVLGNYYERLR